LVYCEQYASVLVLETENRQRLKTPKEYLRQNRRRYVLNGRIVWYGSPSDERYWYEYWKARLNSNYYVSAEARPLTNDELGKVLLRELHPGGLHLEAGCGAGFWMAALRHQGLMVEGIEYAQNLVDLVLSISPRLPIRWGNALSIDSLDNYYDSYLSFGVVEHRFQGPEPFLSEAYRVLKPGGKVIISVPFFGPIRRLKNRLLLYERTCPDLPFFQYGFSRRDFTGYFQEAGFSIEELHILYVDRLLLEEVTLYRWLSYQRWGHFIKKWAEMVLQNRDGHMLLVVGRKPAHQELSFVDESESSPYNSR